ncbi:hypothetical protein FF1_009656 [Malus domestica]
MTSGQLNSDIPLFTRHELARSQVESQGNRRQLDIQAMEAGSLCNLEPQTLTSHGGGESRKTWMAGTWHSPKSLRISNKFLNYTRYLTVLSFAISDRQLQILRGS